MGDDPGRILVVLDDGIVGGGAERVAAGLITAWIDRGEDVRLATANDTSLYTGGWAPPVPQAKLEMALSSEPKLKRWYRKVYRVLWLRRVVRESGARTVVSFLTATNVRAVLATRGLGVRLVISERNDTTRKWLPRRWDWLRRRLYRYADAVTANSRVSIEDMKRYVPEEKLHLVPNAVVVPDEAASPRGSSEILNVARLVPQKGHELLVSAFARLREELPDWRLTIVGDGQERPNLASLVDEQDLGDRVTFAGLVDDPSPWYARAAIFVLPSEYEGTSNALLEAMAHGLPCVVSDTLPGVLEFVHDGVSGLTFRSGDVADLATKIRELAEEPDLRSRLGDAARRRMRDLDPQAVLRIWDQVLRKATRAT